VSAKNWFSGSGVPCSRSFLWPAELDYSAFFWLEAERLQSNRIKLRSLIPLLAKPTRAHCHNLIEAAIPCGWMAQEKPATST
jgi:hypothetical protein